MNPNPNESENMLGFGFAKKIVGIWQHYDDSNSVTCLNADDAMDDSLSRMTKSTPVNSSICRHSSTAVLCACTTRREAFCWHNPPLLQ